jgi:aryl-alcohol dehydrogenase-like predicted oxidoreductase
VSALAHAHLGRSALCVARVALGSWRTFERMPRGDGLAVMRAAREAGIDFLDDARYDDETGTAPMPSGYSEKPPDGLSVDEVVAQAGALIDAGKLRAWGLLNWPPTSSRRQGRSAERQGVAMPAAVQLPYSLVRRSPVQDPATTAAVEASGASIVASATLAAGALTGKYAHTDASGRIAEQRDDPVHQAALAAGQELLSLAAQFEAPPAALAIAFALRHPNVASVLLGATSLEQVEANVAALDLLDRLGDDDRARLDAIGVTSGEEAS